MSKQVSANLSPELEKISKILSDKFKKEDTFLFEENTDNNNKIFKMKREISSKNVNYLLFRYDLNEYDFIPFFNDTGNLKKFCDYILFVEEVINKKQYLNICLIELKLGNDNTNAKKQLEASKVFIDYVFKSAERIGYEIVNYKILKIIISESKANKGTTGSYREENILTKHGDYFHYTHPKTLLVDYLLNYHHQI